MVGLVCGHILHNPIAYLLKKMFYARLKGFGFGSMPPIVRREIKPVSEEVPS